LRRQDSAPQKETRRQARAAHFWCALCSEATGHVDAQTVSWFARASGQRGTFPFRRRIVRRDQRRPPWHGEDGNCARGREWSASSTLSRPIHRVRAMHSTASVVRSEKREGILPFLRREDVSASWNCTPPPKNMDW